MISSHAFELLHTFLSHYPKVYFFANHGSPSFGTALSFTFVGDIAMAGYTLLLAFLIFKTAIFSELLDGCALHLPSSSSSS